MSEPAVKLENVDLTLGSGAARVHVLRDVNLTVEAGETVGLVGPSGSGKTTILMIVAGLERIDSGKIAVAGTDYAGLGEDQLATFRGANIGFVFQSFHLMQTMTALENVAVPLELAGVDAAFERARDMLGRVGLGERLSHYPAQMSGGEQQRVAIARALVVEPRLLIADEPTGNLDAGTGGDIADLIFEAAAEQATTLLLVTHDAALAGRCGHTVHMDSGRLLDRDGAPAAGSAPALRTA